MRWRSVLSCCVALVFSAAVATASVSQIVQGGAAETVNDNTTVYIPLGSSVESGGIAARNDLEILQDLDIDDLKIQVSNNDIAASSTFVLQKDTGTGYADTAMTITIGSTAEGWIAESSPTTISFAAGDGARFKLVTGTSSSNTLSITAITYSFTPDDTGDTLSLFSGHSGGSSDFSSATTIYVGFHGDRATGTTESDFQFETPIPMTIQGFFVQTGTNTWTGDVDLFLRVNGSSTAATVQYTADDGLKIYGGSGIAVSAGDELNYMMTLAAGSGTFQLERIGCWGVTSDDTFVLLAMSSPSDAVSTTASDSFMRVGGTLKGNATETNIEIEPEFTFTVSNLFIRTIENTKAAVGTELFVRDNGSSGDGQIRIWQFAEDQVDVEGVDTITGGSDTLAHYLDIGASGNLRLRYVGLVGDSTLGGGGGTPAGDTFEHGFQVDGGTFTTTSPHEFTCTPARRHPKGIVVIVVQNDGTARITSVDYGTESMTLVDTAHDLTDEDGTAYAYFLGSSIPEWDQTVSITHDGDTSTKVAACYTISGSADTEVVDFGVVEDNVDDPGVSLDSGARDASRYFGIFSGLGNPGNIGPKTGFTSFTSVDFGPNVAEQGYQTAVASGSVETGSNTASSDDVALIALAVAEVEEAAGGGLLLFEGSR